MRSRNWDRLAEIAPHEAYRCLTSLVLLWVRSSPPLGWSHRPPLADLSPPLGRSHHRSTNTQDPTFRSPAMHRRDRLSFDLGSRPQAMHRHHHPRPISFPPLKTDLSFPQSLNLWSLIFFFVFVVVVVFWWFLCCVVGGFCVDSGGFSMGACVWVVVDFLI